MKSRRVAFLGLVGFLFVLWFGANGCSLDTTGFGETDPVCTVDAHCDDHIVCTIDKCAENGVCVHTANADGLFPDGVSGNCKAYGCKDGKQGEIQLTDDVDDGNECTKDVCTDTGATHEADTGAPCHMGGGLGKCDADKKCVIACGYKDENGMEVGCPKSDDDCSLSYCDNSVGQCVLDQLDGVAVPGTNPADCGGSYCVKGKTTTSASLADTPCMDTTAGGKPATVCDGAGECVECNADEQCIPVGTPPSDCFTPKCNANKCENIVKDNVDLPIAQQVPSDCQIKRCDMGLVVSVADDSDKPNDNDNVCTFDVCTNGVPSNPPVPAGTDCGTGAGGNPLVCNAVGVCVGCNSPLDCQGTDDECKARTCVNQECGVSYTPNDTKVLAQTAGDCMKQVCNGAGSIVAAQDNVDAPPDDGNQCTDEVCTNGTPAHPNKTAGSACNDANGCSQSDTCQAGACVGSNPVTCSALDQCHDAGVCNPASGMCSNPNKPNNTACTDSNACTQTDSCQSGSCVGAMPVVCTALDQCHSVGTCNIVTGVCSNPNKGNGTACMDGNACTQTDTCQAGTCTGGSPVTCMAADQCHVPGVCDTVTGVCSNPNKANGAACSDANACTTSDTCQSGTCISGSPVVCMALDQCHNAGTCNVGTGICTNPNKANGTACNDGSLCTTSDTCQSGNCTGASPVVCTAMDQCHDVGTCAPATGICSNPNKANGASCSDSNACTQTDTCQSGACMGGNPVTCAAPDQCHNAATCVPATGVCSYPNKADGTMCSDGSACTMTDTCVGGTCTGANPVVCTPNQCQTGGTCNAGNGTCSFVNKVDSTSCSDMNACTTGDACQNGACISGSPVLCLPLDQCHNAGTCDMGTGVCSNPAKADNTMCNDNDSCTVTESCQVGVCTGATFLAEGAACVAGAISGTCNAAHVCTPP